MKLTPQEAQLAYNILTTSSHTVKAIFTPEAKRTDYQVSIMSLWNKLHDYLKDFCPICNTTQDPDGCCKCTNSDGN